MGLVARKQHKFDEFVIKRIKSRNSPSTLAGSEPDSLTSMHALCQISLKGKFEEVELEANKFLKLESSVNIKEKPSLKIKLI